MDVESTDTDRVAEGVHNYSMRMYSHGIHTYVSQSCFRNAINSNRKLGSVLAGLIFSPLHMYYIYMQLTLKLKLLVACFAYI